MLFNSVEFLIFFIVVTFLYFSLPHRARWVMLLLASCIFYMFFRPIYILILGFTIIVDYYAGILIGSANTAKQKKRYLVLSIIANVGVLAVFKYFNFINDNITGLCSIFGYTNEIPYLNILLPIGLSFHTFQAMSYTLEVYRGNQVPEKHFGIYALYVMFYPQLVAGPIERPQNLLHQFHEKHYFNKDNFNAGIRLMIWGLFKKVVIADRLAIFVDRVYENPGAASPAIVVLTVGIFAIQIYCDFSGYSDIAIGSAKVMGFDLMTNFNRPFSSRNITEFWRKWHISLSTWFNDYIYTPLVIEKRDWGKSAIVIALLSTFLLSGIWHGAGWVFIIYGLLHGVATVFEFLTKKWRKKASKNIPGIIYNPLSQLITFAFVAFSWIFFRSGNLNIAHSIISRIFDFSSFSNYIINTGQFDYYSLAVAAIMMLALYLVESKVSPKMNEWNYKLLPQLVIYGVVLTFIICFGVFSKNSFIYFQF